MTECFLKFIVEPMKPENSPQWVIDWIRSRDWFDSISEYVKEKNLDSCKSADIYEATTQLGIHDFIFENQQLIVLIPNTAETALYILQRNQ